ncbi:AMIN domain-containing protein [Archangium lansingense]|uniref:AMIN domain-containing protein n=1 Tax=Archangium lansingense TaxID=2995310 RepID=UPI003B7DB90A
MVALLTCVLVPTVALAQEGQAQGNLNTITGVNVTGGRVEIVGTKKPNFTTFTMTDPPRLVIDISEAVFSGVKEEVTVGNGTITGIRTASYGSDESAIARVLIGYEREVETDIQATGNSLVVSVAGSGGAAVAARPTTAPGTAPAAAGTAPAATATQPGVSADQAAAAAQADRQQQEKAAAQAAAAAQADRQQQEKAAAQAATAAQADAEAQRQAQARAEAERKAQEESARVSAQQAEQRRLQEERAAKESAAAAEKQRQQDEARAAAEQKQRQQADEKARREADAQASAEAKKRQQDEARAATEEKKRQAAEDRQARLEEAQAAAEERKAAAEERRRQQAEARQTRIAQAETPRREPEQGDSGDVSSRRKTMTQVGFKQEPNTSRVFVRTNEPVRYTVTEGNKEVVLELENTRIGEENNTRSMNTSFFDTAVVSVDANAGPSRTVRVAIKLKEKVTYQTRQDGNEVSIEFQRPRR